MPTPICRETPFADQCATKTPDECRRYTWNFTNELETGDKIIAAEVDAGDLVSSSVTYSDTKVTSAIAGGTLGANNIPTSHVVKVKVTTQEGDTLQMLSRFFVSES